MNAILHLALPIVVLASAASADEVRAHARTVAISVTEDGFTPKRASVLKNEEVKLVFTRKTERTCAKEVIVYVTDKETIRRKLPLNVPVEITVKFPISGEFGFACPMAMKSGRVLVE
jgi:plastocyanin domain-containing protein